jgi:hypothetical protein
MVLLAAVGGGTPEAKPAWASTAAPSRTMGRGKKGVSPGRAKASFQPNSPLPGPWKGVGRTAGGGRCSG